MKNKKQKLKKIVEVVAIKSAKTACGTASVNFFGQPKEPKNIKTVFKDKK